MLFVRLNPRLLFKWRQHRRRHAAHKPRDRAGQNLTHDAHLLLATTATLLCAALLRAALLRRLAAALLAAAGRALAARRFTRAALLAGRFLRRLFPAALFPRRRFLTRLLCWHSSLFSLQ